MKLVQTQKNSINKSSNKKPANQDLTLRGVVVEGRKQPLIPKPSYDEQQKMVSYFLSREKALKKPRPMTIQSNSKLKNPYNIKTDINGKNNRFLIRGNKQTKEIPKNLQITKEKDSIANLAFNFLSKSNNANNYLANNNGNILKMQLITDYDGTHSTIIDSVTKTKKNRFAQTSIPSTSYSNGLTINSIVFPNGSNMVNSSTKNSQLGNRDTQFRLDPIPISAKQIMSTAKSQHDTLHETSRERNSMLSNGKSTYLVQEASISKDKNFYNSDLRDNQTIIVVTPTQSSVEQHSIFMKELSERAQQKNIEIDNEIQEKDDDAKYDEIIEVSNDGYTNSRENSHNNVNEITQVYLLHKTTSDTNMKLNTKALTEPSKTKTPTKMSQIDSSPKSIVDTYLKESIKSEVRTDGNENTCTNKKTEKFFNKDNVNTEVESQKNVINNQKNDNKKPVTQNSSFSKGKNNNSDSKAASARIQPFKSGGTTTPTNNNNFDHNNQNSSSKNNTTKSKVNSVGTVTISVPKNQTNNTPNSNKKQNVTSFNLQNNKDSNNTITIKNSFTEDSDLVFNEDPPTAKNDSK